MVLTINLFEALPALSQAFYILGSRKQGQERRIWRIFSVENLRKINHFLEPLPTVECLTGEDDLLTYYGQGYGVAEGGTGVDLTLVLPPVGVVDVPDDQLPLPATEVLPNCQPRVLETRGEALESSDCKVCHGVEYPELTLSIWDS